MLLIDEVDVFLGQHFYGESLNLIADLRNEDIKQVQMYYW